MLYHCFSSILFHFEAKNDICRYHVSPLISLTLWFFNKIHDLHIKLLVSLIRQLFRSASTQSSAGDRVRISKKTLVDMDVTSMVVTKDIETEELTDNTETPPAIREGQSLKRWSIYFNSKKYRSYSVRTSCSSTTAIQQPKRMSDCIGLQNLKVKKGITITFFKVKLQIFRFI